MTAIASICKGWILSNGFGYMWVCMGEVGSQRVICGVRCTNAIDLWQPSCNAHRFKPKILWKNAWYRL